MQVMIYFTKNVSFRQNLEFFCVTQFSENPKANLGLVFHDPNMPTLDYCAVLRVLNLGINFSPDISGD